MLASKGWLLLPKLILAASSLWEDGFLRCQNKANEQCGK